MDHRLPEHDVQLTRPAILLGAILLSGCGLSAGDAATSGAGGEAPGPAKMCSGAGDCPSGLACSSGLGACYDPSHTTEAFAFQVLPPSDSPLVGDQRTEVTLHGDNQYNIQLSEAVIVKGLVPEKGNPVTPSVPAQIVAETPGDIPGTVLRANAKAIGGVYDDNSAFTLRLIPGRPYDIRVFPEDEGRPPEHLQRTFQVGDSTLIIELPQKKGPAAYPIIRGTVHDAAFANEKGEAPPLGHVQVVAFEAAAPDSDVPPIGLTSTLATTESKQGGFELRVPARPAWYVLQLTSTSQMEGRLIPKTQTDPVLSVVQVTGEYGESKDVGPLVVESFPAATVSIDVYGIEADGSSVAVADAKVTAKAMIGLGAFTTQGTTAASPAGRWSGQVIAGTYDVTVKPPATSPFRSRTVTMDLAEGQGVKGIELERRVEVDGVVTGWDGAPVAGASVRAFVQDAGADSVPDYQTKTDEDGRFSWFIDPGPWSVLAIPPAGSPYPRVPAQLIEFEGERQTVELELPLPRLIQGSVTGPGGEPVSGVAVEVYRTAGDEVGCLVACPGAAPLLLGEALTDEQGDYRLLVPAETSP
jgi:protocatechuate 3,4-dioxygenase beta subunit